MECQLEEAFEAVVKSPADSNKRQSVSKKKGSVVGGGAEAKSTTLDPKVTSALLENPNPEKARDCLRVGLRTSQLRLYRNELSIVGFRGCKGLNVST